MKFIRDLISRKSAPAAQEPDVYEDLSKLSGMPEQEAKIPLSQPMRRNRKLEVREESAEEAVASAEPKLDDASVLVLDNMKAHFDEPAPVEEAKPVVNIWDLEDDATPAETQTPEPSSRRRRNKTRMLGFDSSGGDVVSMFDEAEKAETGERSRFPVGWILVVDGPGRGECFTLEPGMSQIGRGNDQAIQLDFGDNSISRSNHAAVVYDTETYAFTIGHGGKKNIVRLNGNPVISNEPLNTGDKIKIGETTLHFVALCSEEFNWVEETNTEENEDVAIA